MTMNNVYGQPIDLAYLQYLLLDGRTQYVLTLTTLEENLASYSITFERIVNSFTLTD